VTHALKARPAKANVRNGFLNVAADYLGLDRKALVQELRAGKSLAQIATAKNTSVDGLETALFNAFKAKVDKAVAAGKLNSAVAQMLLQHAPAMIERVVNAHR
jgi:hypothetical protein